MEAWKKKDYKKMFSLCQLTWKEGKSVKDLENLLTGRVLTGYALISTSTLNSVSRKFHYELLYDNGTVIRVMANVICEKEPYKTATHGVWGVSPLSATKAIATLDAPEFTAAKKKAPARKPAAKKTASGKTTKKKTGK